MKCDTKKIHIAIIILGSIFILLSAFHSSLWFDETYSVALANHNISEIWSIGGNDVHPILYYIGLRILNLIFGNNIIIYRLFSAIPVIIMGILGFTHIRKDFGKKTGIIFSFLSLFLPVMSTYAVEIRMYTWAMLLTTLTAIYAYRIVTKEYKIHNFILFGLFSLMSAYTHYYGLMFAGIINIMLFIWILRKKKEYLKIFVIIAIIQIIAYVPWLINFLVQLKNVSGGFWIGFSFPDTLYELITVQYAGILDKKIIVIFPVILYTYFIIRTIINKRKKYLPLNEKDKLTFQNIEEQKLDMKWANIALGIYMLIIIMALVVSIFLHTLILYYRYLIVISGLLIFFIAEFMAKEKNKFINILICAIILIISVINNCALINRNYDINNNKAIEYLQENLQSEDILIYKKIDSAIFAVNFEDNKQYFWDAENWNVEEAYKAYGPQMDTVKDLSILDNYIGRIWVIDSDDLSLYSECFKEKDNYVFKSSEKFYTPYQNCTYNLILLEKVR